MVEKIQVLLIGDGFFYLVGEPTQSKMNSTFEDSLGNSLSHVPSYSSKHLISVQREIVAAC